MSRLRGLPFYPAAIAAACILATYVPPIPPIPWVIRPVLVAVGLIVLLQLALSGLARDRHKGAFFGAVLALFVAVWELGAILVAIASAQLLVASIRRKRMATIDFPALTRFLNATSSIVLIVTIVMGASRGVVLVGPSGPPGDVPTGTTPPDLYLIMLDGYPRADSLQRDFAFDNTPFLDAMAAQGFEVAEQAHSNYNITWMTLATTFNAEHLATLMPNPPPSAHGQLGELHRLIYTGSALEAARRAGYELIAITGGHRAATVVQADRFIDTGQVNDYEQNMLRTGIVPYVLPRLQADVVHQQLRDRFNSMVAAVRALSAEASQRPRLVFTHFIAPHPPIVFNAEGGPSSDDGCYPLGCGIFDQAYDMKEPQYLPEELQYINWQIADLAADIIANSDRPVAIVVFSDHGFRALKDNLQEMVHNLFLSYTPGAPELFPDDASPINILPNLLNHYAGLDLPVAADESWVADFRKFESRQSYFPLDPIEP